MAKKESAEMKEIKKLSKNFNSRMDSMESKMESMESKMNNLQKDMNEIKVDVNINSRKINSFYNSAVSPHQQTAVERMGFSPRNKVNPGSLGEDIDEY